MNTLYVTRGLPGSGKTTRALAAVAAAAPGTVARMNRDSLRMMMFGGWTGDRRHEEAVSVVQHQPTRDLLRMGMDVIVDDTNLPEQSMQVWRDLAAVANARVVVWDLRLVPLQTCLLNNDKRAGTPGYVPPGDIQNMWAEHIEPILSEVTAT